MKQWKSAVMALLLLLVVGCGAAAVPDSEGATGQSPPSEGVERGAPATPETASEPAATLTKSSTATAEEGSATPMPEPDPSATPQPAPTDTPLTLPTEAPLPTKAEPTAAANLAPQPTAESTPQLVVPVTVNLSEITPQPVGSVEPVELPNPGNPNPTAALANKTAQDLAARLAIDVSQVAPVQVEEVEWPDSGLGCATPNQVVMDVITPGFRIVLEAQGQQYVYHTDRIGTFVLCQNGQPAPPLDQ